MIHISLYVPIDHSEKVKSAMFKAGAGRIGNYENCSFEIEGKGQFRPMDGSDPFLGKTGVVESVRELKIEMVCEDQYIEGVIAALKAAHPYETPAYYTIKTLGN